MWFKKIFVSCYLIKYYSFFKIDSYFVENLFLCRNQKDVQSSKNLDERPLRIQMIEMSNHKNSYNFLQLLKCY